MNLASPMFWIVHAASSLVVAGLAYGIGTQLHARLRLSHAARGYWLAVWTLATLPPLLVAIVLACMPGTVAVLPMALPLPAAIDPGPVGQVMASEVPTHLQAWPSLAVVLAAVYTVGLGIVLLRWLRGSAVIAGVVGNARSADPADWPGTASAAEAARLAQRGIVVRITARPMSPFAVRWPRQCIVLPADALTQMSDAGLRLVLRHEAAHLTLRDPQRALLMSAVGALLWFNPFVRAIGARVQVASELRCDACALDGDMAAGRTLASAYLHTLRSYASMDAPAVALNHRDLAGHALRIRHMLGGDASPTLPRTVRIGLAGLGLAAAGLLSLLQMALATPAIVHAPASPSHQHAPSRDDGHASAAPAAQSQFHLASPVDTPKITGRFGETGRIRSRPHRGTDFGARVGTPVLAPAAGVVTAATTRYPDGPNYGTVVVLDHGNGWQTLFAHLDGFDVRVGQHVVAGERIARVGRSGRVTGPHLHLEALLDGQRVDPERLLQ